MIGLLLKIIIFPIGVILCNYLFGLDYTVTQALLVAFILIAADQVMEFLILREGSLWTSTIIDSFVAFLIIYLSQYYLTGVTISIWAAIGTTLVISLVEYFQHAYLIRSGHTHRVED